MNEKMHKITCFVIIVAANLLISSSILAQSPNRMSYQAVIRNSSNSLVTNTQVGIRIQIWDEINDQSIYTEIQTPITNDNGLISIEIGSEVGFDTISWMYGNYFIQTDVDPDPAGGLTDYSISGLSQLLSVPFAIHSKTAETLIGGIDEIDPEFNLSPAQGILSTDIINWNTSFSWGDHASAGYLLSYDEIDPEFNLSPAQGILSTDIINWNTSFSWGDHVGLYRPITYVPTWTEITSKPFNITSPAHNQLLKYNLASSKWENWTPNFLVTEVDGSITNEIQNLSSVLTTGSDANNNSIVNVSQQGIGTATPNASAALEISSTTKGFLPPRMSEAQMLALTPVEGLIIYNTLAKRPLYYNGTDWVNMDGSIAIYIGKAYQGGVIAYILQSSDPGYVCGQIHGLIAAPTDQGSGISWGCTGTSTGASGTAIGTGNQNTIDILADCTTSGIAARLCGDLVIGIYSDWYLPSKDEIAQLNINREAIGNFAFYTYWSSSETSSTNAWIQGFGSGTASNMKTGLFCVRAIRSF
jgi:hypothetical protein